MGRIPWSKIELYCDRLNLSWDLRQSMHHHITAMDVAYLQFKAKQAENRNKNKANG